LASLRPSTLTPCPLSHEARERGPGGEGFAAGPRLTKQPPREHAKPSTHAIEHPEALADTEDDLFASAQRAHFDQHDPASALHAWDAYLATFPRGRFELEARYNRATTLLRLGRDEEARAALIPFASGPYRSREARLLLQSLVDEH